MSCSDFLLYIYIFCILASVVTVNSADPVEINTAEPNVEESKVRTRNMYVTCTLHSLMCSGDLTVACS